MEEIATNIAAPLERILDEVGVSRAFGEPVVQGDVTVIPVAEVFLGVGFGFGGGPAGPAALGAEGTGEGGSEGGAESGTESGPAAGAEAAEGSGARPAAGGGGGGGGRARPVGVFRVGPGGVSFEPIVDPTRMALGGMVLAGWVVFWASLTVRAVARAISGR